MWALSEGDEEVEALVGEDLGDVALVEDAAVAEDDDFGVQAGRPLRRRG